MIEAVGANYFGSYARALDDLLAPDGVAVLQAITIPEHRYAEYIRSTDFINTVGGPAGRPSGRASGPRSREGTRCVNRRHSSTSPRHGSHRHRHPARTRR